MPTTAAIDDVIEMSSKIYNVKKGTVVRYKVISNIVLVVGYIPP